MKARQLLSWVLLAASVTACSLFPVRPIERAGAAAPAPAPAGFQWYAAKGIGSFLRPYGWFVREERKGDTNVLFITRESIDEASGGRFSVGLAVNRVSRFSLTSTLAPSAYAKRYVAQLGQRYEVLKSGLYKGPRADMNIVRLRIDRAGTPTVQHLIAAGFDREDAYFVLWFEAPQAEWESLYDVARPMLNQFEFAP